MSGYGQETRSSDTKSVVNKRFSKAGVYINEVLPSRTYSSEKETTLSYRTKPRGKLIPDTTADPYAYFLKNGAAVDIARLQKGDSYSSTAGTETLFGFISSPNKPPHVDNGHAFVKEEQTCYTSARQTNYNYNPQTQFNYIGGPMYASGAIVNTISAPRMLFKFESQANTFGLISTRSTQELKAHGIKAIGTLAPNRPDISLAAILGELREGLPSLIGINAYKSRTETAKRYKSRTGKAAGNEWLNLQFGIVPLMSDIKSTYDALMSVSERLFQYEVDAGNGIRRRMSFPTKREMQVFETTNLSNQGRVTVDAYLNPTKDAISSSADYAPYDVRTSTLTQNISERIWFNGSFTYFVPVGKDLSSNFAKYTAYGNKLFGISMTPETLWQLSPWSWLTDWFLDIGASISAYERIQDDNLVVNYGYVMGTSKKTATQRTVVPAAADKRLQTVISTVTSLRKERLRANPYGFSVATSTELNPMKWSILAALGFSKFL